MEDLDQLRDELLTAIAAADGLDALEKALFVNRREIAGLKISVVSHGCRGRFGVVPVPGHDLRPLGADFTHFAHWHFVTLFVSQ